MPVFNNTDGIVTERWMQCNWMATAVVVGLIFLWGGSYVHYRAKRLSSGRRADTSLSSVSASTSGSNTQSPF